MEGDIEHVATDLSDAFISAVRKNLLWAQMMFDHCHVMKIINDTVDKLHRFHYHHSKLQKEQRDVIKGIRWLLLKNGEDIKTEATQEIVERGPQNQRAAGKDILP